MFFVYSMLDRLYCKKKSHVEVEKTFTKERKRKGKDGEDRRIIKNHKTVGRKTTTEKCCTRLKIISNKCKYFQKGLDICAQKHVSTHSYICSNTNKNTYNRNPDIRIHTMYFTRSNTQLCTYKDTHKHLSKRFYTPG